MLKSDNKILIDALNQRISLIRFKSSFWPIRIITKLFDSDLEPFLKLQLKEMVIVMGEISDQADRVSKRVNIMTMKRRV